MRKFVLMILAVFLSCSMATMAFAENLKKGDVVYAKYSIRGKGKEVFWHNMSALPVLIPVGSEVKVDAINAAKIIIEVSGRKFMMVSNTAQWDKFFAKDKAELKATTAEGPVKDGMSKEEVYVVKGCPAYISEGDKSNTHSYAEIMQSDYWVYNANSRSKDMVVTFENGKVAGALDKTTQAKSKAQKKIKAVKEQK